jgi:hypothetical protein
VSHQGKTGGGGVRPSWPAGVLPPQFPPLESTHAPLRGLTRGLGAHLCNAEHFSRWGPIRSMDAFCGDVRNAWGVSAKGYLTHCFDDLVLFGVLSETLPFPLDLQHSGGQMQVPPLDCAMRGMTPPVAAGHVRLHLHGGLVPCMDAPPHPDMRRVPVLHTALRQSDASRLAGDLPDDRLRGQVRQGDARRLRIRGEAARRARVALLPLDPQHGGPAPRRARPAARPSPPCTAHTGRPPQRLRARA